MAHAFSFPSPDPNEAAEVVRSFNDHTKHDLHARSAIDKIARDSISNINNSTANIQKSMRDYDDWYGSAEVRIAALERQAGIVPYEPNCLQAMWSAFLAWVQRVIAMFRTNR